MRMESDGHSRGNPRLYELIENVPKEGKSPTVWAWPQLIDYLKIAGQPVAGPGRPIRSRARIRRRTRFPSRWLTRKIRRNETPPGPVWPPSVTRMAAL